MNDAEPVLYSEDAEQAVLSAAMQTVDGAAPIDQVRAQLTPEAFYSESHRRIYAAMLTLRDAQTRLDPITLSRELARRGELETIRWNEYVGKDYIGWLVDAVPTAASIDDHAAIVVERAQLRRLRAEGASLVRLVDEGKTPTVLLAERFVRAVQPIAETAADGLPRAMCALEDLKIEPIEWAIEDLWPKGEVGALVGDGGSFKSTNALAIAGSIAGGYRLWNRFATMQRPAVIISAEDSGAIVKMRLEALVRGCGWDRTRVLGGVHVIADHGISIADVAWQAHIGAEARRVDAGCVVLDPWADLLGDKDENRNTDLRPIIAFLRGLAARSRGIVVLVHHVGKPAEGKRTIDRIRGGSALINAMRTALMLEDSEVGIRVEHLKANRGPKLPTFILSKQIEASPRNRAHWQSAVFTYADARTVTLSRAEEFVLAQVTASPRLVNSSDIRKAAAGSGINNQDIGAAITKLERAGRIAFEIGPKNARMWYPVRLPEPLGNQPESRLPWLPDDCPASTEQPACVVAPLKGAGNHSQAQLPLGNQAGEHWEPDESQAQCFDDDRGEAWEPEAPATDKAADCQISAWLANRPRSRRQLEEEAAGQFPNDAARRESWIAEQVTERLRAEGSLV